MRRKAILTVFVVGISAVIAAGSAMAGPLQSVQIEVETDLNTPISSPDPFFASGPAVTFGCLCSAGTVYTDPYNWPPPPGGSVTMIKRFSCGGDTFDVKLRVWLLAGGDTEGKWKVIGGTGAYAGLIGNGTLTGTYDEEHNTVFDVYMGKVGSPGPPSTTPPWWAGGPQN